MSYPEKEAKEANYKDPTYEVEHQEIKRVSDAEATVERISSRVHWIG